MNITKKITGALTGALVAAMIFGFVALPTAQALTQAEANGIIAALGLSGSQAAAIQALVTAGTQAPAATCDTYGTTSIVRVGNTGEKVKAIQRAMNQILDLSNGTMTPLVVDGAFGPLTKGVVQYFQGVIGTTPDGIWGPNTQGSYVTYVANNCTSAPVVPGVPAGSASAGISSGTPGAMNLATGGNANVTKFFIKAGSQALTVDDLVVTRSGLSENNDWQDIKILDANGVQISNSGSLNSNNKVSLSFSPDVVIAAGTTAEFFIRAGVASTGVNAGTSAKFGIESIGDIDFVGGAPAGMSASFPMYGNLVSPVTLSIGSVTVSQDGTTPDSTPDAGDTDVVVNKFKVESGSTEGVIIDQMQFELAGSASAGDVSNIELYSVTNNQTVATVSSFDSRDLVTFNNLNISLGEGASHRFQVRLDIVDGSGETVNVDLVDGTDVRMQVRGVEYGYYINATAGGFTGLGSSNQTIAAGAFTISKASQSPATGSVAEGNNVLLGVFDFTITGEPVRIEQLVATITATDAGGSETLSLASSATSVDVTNVRLRNYTTNQSLGGPNDLIGTGADIGDATFTDVFELPVGTTKLAVYADLKTAFEAGDTVVVDIKTPATSVTSEGVQSGDAITASPSGDVAANTLTVKAGALASSTLTTPAARSVVVGAQDFLWAEFNFSAANSGENVEITDITIATAIANSAAYADLDNVEIWANLSGGSSNDSSRGDRYETRVSDTKQNTGATLAFTLNQSVSVAKDAEVRMAVIADLSSGATAAGSDDTYTVDLSAVTANGADTGTAISSTPSGSGQAMTSETGGALTVSVDSSSPTAKLVLDAGQSGKETLGIFRLQASQAENLDLDSFKITDDGSDSAVETYYFQAMHKNGTTVIGPEKSITGGATAEVFWADGEVTVPSNDYILMYVKGQMADVDTSSADNESSVEVTVDASGDVDTTGLASGAAVDSTATSQDAATHYLFQAYPTFAWQTLGTTTLTNNANHLIGKLKITAVGNEDVSFLKGITSEIVFQAAVVGDDTDTASETISFRDEQGTLLDTLTFTSATAAVEGTVNFSTEALTIPAGGSKTIFVYADTSDLEDDNDSIQLWLDNTTAADLSWAIDGAGDYDAQASIVWRNDNMSDAYAQLHINP